MLQKQNLGEKRLANNIYSMTQNQNINDNGLFFAFLFCFSIFFLLLFFIFDSKIFIICLLYASHIYIKLIVTLSMLKWMNKWIKLNLKTSRWAHFNNKLIPYHLVSWLVNLSHLPLAWCHCSVFESSNLWQTLYRLPLFPNLGIISWTQI